MKFSHLNKNGEVHMVSVGEKLDSKRKAVAHGFIRLNSNAIKIIKNQENKKGDVLAVARLGGIVAAKKTSELVLLAHNIVIDGVEVDLLIEEHGIRVTASVECSGKTGVEMEALTAVTMALLNVYDMCKAVDKEMRIENVELLTKQKN